MSEIRFKSIFILYDLIDAINILYLYKMKPDYFYFKTQKKIFLIQIIHYVINLKITELQINDFHTPHIKNGLNNVS